MQRMFEVGMDLWRPPGLTPAQAGPPEQAAQNYVQVVFGGVPQRGRLHSLWAA